MTTQQRHPAGTPTGGQWAPTAHAEPDIDLAPSPRPAARSKVTSALLGVVVGAGAVSVPSSQALATVTEIGVVPPQNPATNCNPPVAENGSGNQADMVQALDICRTAEDVGPVTLPSNWSRLDPAQQLLIAVNLERTDRGEQPIAGLSRRLDADAKKGAKDSTDPSTTLPASWWGVYAFPPSSLGDVWAWTYDDGLGSLNTGCTIANRSGCWGHRDALLAHSNGRELVAGAACATGGCDMLIVATNLPLWFKWANEIKYFPQPPSLTMPWHPVPRAGRAYAKAA